MAVPSARGEANYAEEMTGSSPRMWSFRFVRPDGSEIEAGAFAGEGEAEDHARVLSKSGDTPVKVERQSLVDWDYVTEVDERS